MKVLKPVRYPITLSFLKYALQIVDVISVTVWPANVDQVNHLVEALDLVNSQAPRQIMIDLTICNRTDSSLTFSDFWLLNHTHTHSILRNLTSSLKVRQLTEKDVHFTDFCRRFAFQKRVVMDAGCGQIYSSEPMQQQVNYNEPCQEFIRCEVNSFLNIDFSFRGCESLKLQESVDMLRRTNFRSFKELQILQVSEPLLSFETVAADIRLEQIPSVRIKQIGIEVGSMQLPHFCDFLRRLDCLHFDRCKVTVKTRQLQKVGL